MRGLLLCTCLLLPGAAAAAPPVPPSALCAAAIVTAERSLRLPSRLLGSIAEVESGRADAAGVLRPWPWTINVQGRGQFFASKRQAIDAVRALQAQGVQSVDVGCLQINLQHHPDAFATLDEAFEPRANALYAARFLNTLYGASGSWPQAAAAYHSQMPAIGSEYGQRVMARWQQRGRSGSAAPEPTAYRAFGATNRVYGAFQPADRTYGAFVEPVAAPARLAHR